MRINRDNFLAGLGFINKVVQPNTNMINPILGCVLIKAESSGNVTLFGTDLSRAAVLTLQADVPEPFETCLPISALITCLTPRIEDEIVLSYDNLKNEVMVKGGKWRAGIKGFDATQFPLLMTLPALKSGAVGSATIDTAVLVDKLTKLGVAATSNKANWTQPQFAIRMIDNQFTVLDGFRFSVQTVENMSGGISVLAPVYLIGLIKQMKDILVKEVTLAATDRHLFIYGEGVYVYTALVNGQYPAVESLIDSTMKTLIGHDVYIDKELLKVALTSALPYGDRVEMVVTNNELTLSVKSQELGDYEERIQCVGDNGRITVKRSLLLECLTQYPEDAVHFQMLDKHPLLISEDSQNYWWVMPYA